MDWFQLMATHSSYSCLENPMDGGAWWATIHGSQRVGHDWVTSLSLFQIGKGVCQGCILSLCLFTLCVEYITHHGKCWVGWITSWNQDCQEKYQQLQICRWYHSNGRKRKVTKEPLDEGEGGQWQIDLKLHIQKTKIYSHHFMANRWGNSERLYFGGLQNHCRWWPQPGN